MIKNIFPKEEKVPQTYIDLLLEKMISPLLKLFDDKIEKIRQITNNKIIKRKMSQTRKNNNNKKKLKNLNSNKKSFFDILI